MRVEIIPKQSVIDDVERLWVATGRKSNVSQGQFVFDGCHAGVDGGVLIINKGTATYIYNVRDFYRIKIVDD